MLRVEDLLGQSETKPINATLDLTRGHCEVPAGSRPKAELVITFLGNAYGLAGAPATFQQLMNAVDIHTFASTYLDACRFQSVVDSGKGMVRPDEWKVDSVKKFQYQKILGFSLDSLVIIRSLFLGSRRRP